MTLGEFSARLPKGDLWVFGYGSLMWSPCFDYKKRALARAHGYHRALCILSTRYRGTQRKPGLVMGLCRGGSCWGMAFRVHAEGVRYALARLWQREMPRRVYAPRLLRVQLDHLLEYRVEGEVRRLEAQAARHGLVWGIVRARQHHARSECDGAIDVRPLR